MPLSSQPSAGTRKRKRSRTPSPVGQAPPVTEQQPLDVDEHQPQPEPTVPVETAEVNDAPRTKAATNVSKGKKVLRQTKLWNDEAPVIVRPQVTRKAAMNTPSTSQESELQRAEWLMEGIELVETTGKTKPILKPKRGGKIKERQEHQITTASTDAVPTSHASGSQGTKRHRQMEPHSDDADDTEEKQTPLKKVRKVKATQADVSLATDPSTWPPSQRLDTTTISKQHALDCYKLKREELAVLEFVKTTHKKNGEEWSMHLYKAADIELIAWKKYGGPEAFEAMLNGMEEKHEKRKGSRRPFRRPRWRVETTQTMEGPISKERLCLSLNEYNLQFTIVIPPPPSGLGTPS